MFITNSLQTYYFLKYKKAYFGKLSKKMSTVIRVHKNINASLIQKFEDVKNKLV